RDDELDVILDAHAGVDPALDAARHLAPPLLRQLVEAKLRDGNVISGAYKHVDGTSFAAPIVSSLAAQMLEANPDLGPHEVKSILVSTARRLPHVAADQQGWGVVEPADAVEEALARAGAGPAA
ncbi:MAG TPA: S8 family serine peptidase, partial [Thermoanaerobaculia bacterium]|nr:S8 family serine peptidase [Thermoanaerobaculia bacterium]